MHRPATVAGQPDGQPDHLPRAGDGVERVTLLRHQTQSRLNLLVTGSQMRMPLVWPLPRRACAAGMTAKGARTTSGILFQPAGGRVDQTMNKRLATLRGFPRNRQRRLPPRRYDDLAHPGRRCTGNRLQRQRRQIPQLFTTVISGCSDERHWPGEYRSLAGGGTTHRERGRLAAPYGALPGRL